MTDRVQTKKEALRRQGCLHSSPQDVVAPAFSNGKFFDSLDLAQVKYEMLRCVHLNGDSVSKAAQSFGFSRQAFYKALEAFQQAGMPGLMSKRRGPKQGHKLTEEILEFIAQQKLREPTLRPQQLSELISKKFGVLLHPSTIRRRLPRRQSER